MRNLTLKLNFILGMIHYLLFIIIHLKSLNASKFDEMLEFWDENNTILSEIA